ncbi:MAG: MFS transporter [Thermoplasmata archaeon]|nr:MFS transporter [Thermoplasmata archaeon]
MDDTVSNLPSSLPTPPVAAPSRLRSAGILAALMMGLLLGALDNFIVVTALPNIAQDLHDVSGQVFVVSSYLIAQTVAIPIFGKLSDRFGRRTFYLFGLGIFLAGSAASGLSQNLDQLIAFRAVQGLGSGAFFTVVFSLVADLFPPEAAARLVGLLSGVFGIAIVFGPLIGSYIIDTTTWRWIFFVNLPVGFAAVALVLTTIRSVPPSADRRRFDVEGAGLMVVWVGALIFALVETSNGWAWTDPRTIGLLAVALVLFPVFLLVEWRAKDPLVPLRLFQKRLVAASSGVNFLRGALLTVVVTFVPILVVQGLGGSTDLSRDILYAFMIPMIIGAALGGMMVARIGYRAPVLVGVILATVGVALLTAVPTTPPIFRFTALVIPLGLAGALIPIGFGVGMTFAPTQLAIQYSVSAKDVGTANSLVWFISNLGGSIVVSLLATFQLSRFTALQPTTIPPGSPAFLLAIHSAVAVSIQDVWWALVPLGVAAILFALAISGRLPKTQVAATAETAAPTEAPAVARSLPGTPEASDLS